MKSLIIFLMLALLPVGNVFAGDSLEAEVTASDRQSVTLLLRQLLDDRQAFKLKALNAYEIIDRPDSQELFSESLRSQVRSALSIIKHPVYPDEPVVSPFFDGSLFTGVVMAQKEWKLTKIVREGDVILALVEYHSESVTSVVREIFVLSNGSKPRIDDVIYAEPAGSLRAHLSEAFTLRIALEKGK